MLLNPAKLKMFLPIFLCAIIHCKALADSSNVVQAISLIGNVLKSCYVSVSATPFNQFLPSLQHCLQNGSLMALDKMQQSKILELSDGIQFVDNNELGLNQTSAVISIGREINWKKQILYKLNRLLHSHNLKIQFSEVFPSAIIDEESRRRRHGHTMPLIIFATVALGMVLIPMGFLFLAVLGGKALLLSKMALILSSIQGLKKIASSNFNYGLYQAHDRC